MTDFLKGIKLFAFDLDGTLYLGDRIIPGAIELIDHLRHAYTVVFFTNNSGSTKTQIHEKLRCLGIVCNRDEIYTSASETVTYLEETKLNNLFVIGTEGFRNTLRENGFHVVDDISADNLVVGFDDDFSYQKIECALTILLKGGRFIACNEDASFPVETGGRKPACGAMVGAISVCAKRKPDFVVGKPNTFILSRIAREHGVQNDETVIVGDSFESDIMMALNYDSKAILVHSPDTVPDECVLVMDNLKNVLHYVKE